MAFGAIDFIISLLTIFPFERPRKTSAPRIASSRLLSCSLVAKVFVVVEISPVGTNNTMTIAWWYFLFCPKCRYSFAQEMAEAPAPLTTIFTSSIFLRAISSALSSAAPEIIAVPCWSSCMIGIFNSAFQSCFDFKTLRCFYVFEINSAESREMAFTVSTNLSTFVSLISISNTSMSAKILKAILSSITGLEALGPMLPAREQQFRWISQQRGFGSVFINIVDVVGNCQIRLSYAGRVG